MVQGITPQQLQALQQLQSVNFGQGNTNLLSQKAESDSFNGKTLLTLAGIAGAIIFRKNIAGFVTKHFPKAAEWCKSNISKPVMNLVKKHRNNMFMKTLLKAHSGFLKLENKCGHFISKLFGKNTANKVTSNVASDVKYVFTDKAKNFSTSVISDLNKSLYELK